MMPVEVLAPAGVVLVVVDGEAAMLPLLGSRWMGASKTRRARIRRSMSRLVVHGASVL